MNMISLKDGIEGPRHDPYSYTEMRIAIPKKPEVIIHRGLVIWVKWKYPGDEFWDVVECDDKIDVNKEVEHLCGYTVIQLERMLRKKDDSVYRQHKAHGGYRSEHGFPGECLCICKCGEIIGCDFDESAVI